MQTTYYQDSDADLYGNSSISTGACSVPVGFTGNGNDCVDTNDDIYPSAPELCDGLDNDCNGLSDDGIGAPTYYPDSDSDGFGDLGLEVRQTVSA